MQKSLNQEQIANFYHDIFVTRQVEHFTAMLAGKLPRSDSVVVDIGGGVGFFAAAIQSQLGLKTRVIDTDSVSISECQSKGVEAHCEDALNVKIRNDEAVICFNLVLHHLVAATETKTRTLQERAITQWKDENVKIFVNEYIYESWIPNFSGWFIYQITKSIFLSTLGLVASKLAPSLKANTFGVGVRFRSNSEWKRVFSSIGYKVIDEIHGPEEEISAPRRLLLIRTIRRDSFLLEKA